MADYATVAEVKAQITKTKTDSDDLLAAMITAASRAIDNYCNRPDGFVALETATARVYTGEGRSWQRIDDCTEITLVEVKEGTSDDDYTSWETTDWQAFAGDAKRPNFNKIPYTAVMSSATGDQSTFTSGRLGTQSDIEIGKQINNAHGVPTVRVTAKWGYATIVPPPINQACITQVARWLKRGQSGWADVLASGDMGQLMYQKMLDPAVKMLLVAGRYVRPAV